MRLKKLIYRTSRGKAFTQFYDIKEKIFDYYGNQINRSIFIVLFPNNFNYLRQRLQIVCDSFMGERFDLPKNLLEIKQQLIKTKNSLDNSYTTLVYSIDNFRKFLESVHKNKLTEGYSLLKVYEQYLTKSKLIYMTMNKMKSKGSLLIGLYWVPKKN